MSVVRTVPPSAAEVLERVAARKRRTVSLPGDSEWLAQLAPHYRRILDEMEGRKSLYRIMRGKYVVAPRATDDADQAVPADLFVDLILRDHTKYYIGFLSAFVRHGLTDLHTDTIYAAVPADAATDLTVVDLPAGRLQLVRLSQSTWPHDERQIRRERAIAGTREFVRRAGLSRTLIDGLLRPELCAGIETVLHGWGRASRQDDFDPEEVWSIAHNLGPGMTKRVALLLRETGHGDIAEAELPDLRRRRSRVLLDRTDALEVPHGQWRRDRDTGVTVNLPARSLRGWLAREIG